MKKFFISAAFVALALPAMAGGLLTNTNQNAAFLRNMSQEGQITLTSLYANPAGNAFLSEGWHLSLNSQTAIQERTINTTFPLFALNTNDPGNSTHEFVGEAFAPVVPSVTLSYNRPKWSVSAHLALGGGGGKCEFDKGLGSFEALYSGTIASQLPAMVNSAVNAQVGAALPNVVAGKLAAMGIPEAYASAIANTGTYNTATTSQMTGYSLDAYMKGRSYYFGLQIGGSYKFTDNLAGYVGLRGVYATCNYNGYVQDVNANYAYNCQYSYDIPANAQLGFPGAQGSGTQEGSGSQSLNDYTLTLNTDQSGFGITPIIGIDWMINDKWNVAAKFEAPTHMSLKNKSEMNAFATAQANQAGNTLAQFKDGEKVREDIPGIVALGAQYSPIEKVRINAGAHYYLDKCAKKYGDKQDLIDHNTWELNAGAEWDCCKLVTISASWQTTQYGLSDAYMNDLSFNLSSNSIGFGVRLHPSKYFNIDLGYMRTLYQDRTVETPTAVGVKSDLYSRTNDVVGIGFNIAF